MSYHRHHGGSRGIYGIIDIMGDHGEYMGIIDIMGDHGEYMGIILTHVWEVANRVEKGKLYSDWK